jgi:hypothetical protein
MYFYRNLGAILITRRNMALTAAHHEIASFIDREVSKYPDTERGTEDLLMNMQDYMGAFKQIMDTSTQSDMNMLCARYPHFYRFAKLLEQVAEGISAGKFDDVLGKK